MELQPCKIMALSRHPVSPISAILFARGGAKANGRPLTLAAPAPLGIASVQTRTGKASLGVALTRIGVSRPSSVALGQEASLVAARASSPEDVNWVQA